MEFKVEELYQKSTEELRAIFSTIPKNKNYIILQGKFNLGTFGDFDLLGDLETSHVAQALAYLPKHIIKAIFRVAFCFRGETRSVPTEPPRGVNAVQKYKKVEYIYKEIGAFLPSYIHSLPLSVNFIEFHFYGGNYRQDYSRVAKGLANALNSLSPTVKSLVFSNLLRYDFDDYFNSGRSIVMREVLQAIPHTVEFFMINKFELGQFDQSILSTLNPKITSLVLANSQLYRLTTQSLSNFSKNLPAKLTTLHLGYNKLSQKTANKLALLLASLAQLKFLKILGLSGNQLANFGVQLAEILAVLSPDLEELDLGENGLLLLDINSFSGFMNKWPRTLTRLRLTENSMVLTKENLKERFLCISTTIETISFNSSNLLGLYVTDFVEVLSCLPDTVQVLDLTNCLNEKTAVEIAYLFANLPSHLKGLKLKHNFLARFNLNELKTILKALSWLEEVNLNNNGFDRLPYTQMQAALSCFPDLKIITESENFKIRNDGALVADHGLASVGLFNTKKRFYHQAEFAKYFLLMRDIARTRLNLDVAFNILCFIINASTEEMKRFQPLFFKTTLISSLPPSKLRPEHEKECLAAIKQRIQNLKRNNLKIKNLKQEYLKNSACLDLSHCGLNRLEHNESQTLFGAELKTLDGAIIALNLRGNGFLKNKSCRKIFTALMKKIPPHIKQLDLSANGFEYRSAEVLEKLLSDLPATVERIILNHEDPLKPALQVAKRRWPDSYLALVASSSDRMQQAHALLNDYTKGDSDFWRLIYLHWDRHYTDEVARLVHYIAMGLITVPEDLLYELTQIKLQNQEGSLAKRFNFLEFYKPKPSAVINKLSSKKQADCEEIEMLTFDRKAYK